MITLYGDDCLYLAFGDSIAAFRARRLVSFSFAFRFRLLRTKWRPIRVRRRLLSAARAKPFAPEPIISRRAR